jgi:hypothetical protein
MRKILAGPGRFWTKEELDKVLEWLVLPPQLAVLLRCAQNNLWQGREDAADAVMDFLVEHYCKWFEKKGVFWNWDPPAGASESLCSAFLGYLRVALKYCCWGAVRRRLWLVDDDGLIDLLGCAPDPVLDLMLKECLDRLQERERNVLDLRQEGYFYNEIAQKLGISEENARIIYHRALRKVRVCLKGELEEGTKGGRP